MEHRTSFGFAILGLGLTWAASASAQPVNGGWYAVEGNTGSVVEFTAGGDLSQVTPFATGLQGPAGMCWGGPGPDLFVASPYLNAVHKITAGGDASAMLPHAYHFPGGRTPGEGALALDCTGDRVLVSVVATGAVFDVTTGGDMTNATPFAEGLPVGEVGDLFTDSTGRVLAAAQMTGIYDITAGGDFTSINPIHAYDLGGPYGLSQITELNGAIYFSNVVPGEIYDFAALQSGDPLSNATAFATGLSVATTIASEGVHLYALDPCLGWSCGVGAIFDATAGGDLSQASPFAGGHGVMAGPTEDLVYIHFCGDGIVRPNSTEECDDSGETATCNANCTTGSCGDGFINATAGEVCDDGTENSDSAADACRTDCTLPFCGDGVTDTMAGEECDDAGDNSDAEPDACRSDCLQPYCGDGIVDAGETCDEGTDNSNTEAGACRTNCALATCGDGVVDSGEDCDDGGDNSDVDPDACRTTCVVARCGDEVLDDGEECDDGNAVNGDGCASDCTDEDPCGGAGGTGACPVCDDGDDDDDGCSVSGAPRGDRSNGLWSLALLGLAALRRRRRRAAHPPARPMR